MNTLGLRIVGTVVMTAAVATGLLWLRQSNQGLVRQTTELPRQLEHNERARTENARIRRVLKDVSERGADADVTALVKEETARLRSEKMALEIQAETRHAKRAAAEAALAINRDPLRGPMRMENFQKSGRATPLTAFQTLVWAAMNGDDKATESMLGFEGRAREQAMAFIATLPPDQQVKFSTPESLAALALAHMMTGHVSAQVLSQASLDPSHSVVTVAFNGQLKGEPLLMQQSESGWKITVTEQNVAEFQRRLATTVQAPRSP